MNELQDLTTESFNREVTFFKWWKSEFETKLFDLSAHTLRRDFLCWPRSSPVLIKRLHVMPFVHIKVA